MPAQGSARRGPQLPYRPIAGVVPAGKKWLVAAGRLQGITLTATEPEALDHFIDVLDYRPSFEIIALAMPIGLPSKPSPGGRTCDREARRLLGWPRSGAILSPPARVAVGAASFADAVAANHGMSGPVWNLLPRIAEVDANIAPYWQRTVFEVHPELSFFQLNGDMPLKHGKRTDVGRDERRQLLEQKLPHIERVIEARIKGVRPQHLADAAVCLWSARRIASRGVSRLPEDPEWDDVGLRMEIIR